MLAFPPAPHTCFSLVATTSDSHGPGPTAHDSSPTAFEKNETYPIGPPESQKAWDIWDGPT